MRKKTRMSTKEECVLERGGGIWCMWRMCVASEGENHLFFLGNHLYFLDRCLLLFGQIRISASVQKVIIRCACRVVAENIPRVLRCGEEV